MALRISVDLDGLRWADLYRFVDLARNGGIEPDDQVDVITYGSDPLSVSLSARIYPGADAFAGLDRDSATAEPPGRHDGSLAVAPVSGPPAPPTFGYEAPHERPPAAPPNFPSFDNHADRVAPAPSANGSAFAAYQNQPERAANANGTAFPAFDGQPDRLPSASPNAQSFAGFETAFDRSAEDQAGPPTTVDTPYMEEFARLQEGLMRPVVRRGEDARHERG